ncbi:MAG TPA: glycosyl hydrolase [Verrucomicrobiales bacterium]|nr:glycosyl hydrolase [Verrucomicrobiales bacterium]
MFTNYYLIISLLLTLCFSFTVKGDEKLESYLGDPVFDKKRLFSDQRYPNVVVSKKGTVIAVWGNSGVAIRRSEDGGKSWGEPINVSEKGYNGGGAIVDNDSGDMLLFVEERQPPAPLTVYRSKDDGLNWKSQKTVIEKDLNGNNPSMHMNESGITLMAGPKKGRLLRATRFYGSNEREAEWSKHYTNAIYSDDGGKSWKTSSPFPENGTGEAALVELSDGRIYYNSRVHWPERPNNRRRREAWSFDGGETWKDWKIVQALPDGDQGRAYGCMAGMTRIPSNDKDVIIFSNLDTDASHRERVTVWASLDGGKTWPVKRLVDGGRSGYSSLSVGRHGTPSEGWIYLHYEHDPFKGSHMARFNLSWLLEGELTGNGDLPKLKRGN